MTDWSGGLNDTHLRDTFRTMWFYFYCMHGMNPINEIIDFIIRISFKGYTKIL